MTVQPTWENVSHETIDGTSWITIQREAKLNALNRRTVEELGQAVAHAVASPEVRVIALTGAGEKAFVAGADIAEMSELSPAEAQQFSRFLQTELDRIEQSPKPVIGAINGFALGGGCELAMACHLRIASDNARFGQPEVNLGLIPGAGGTQRLPRLVGRGRALELTLSGNVIDAAEAYRIGLVNQVSPAAELRDRVTEFAATLASKSPRALERSIQAILGGADLSLEQAQQLEASLFGLCFATEDMREGTRAFLEKRKPDFPGR